MGNSRNPDTVLRDHDEEEDTLVFYYRSQFRP